MALHPETRQLARPGRIRTRRPVLAMPQSRHLRPANSHHGSRRLAARPQSPQHQSRLALHNRKCPVRRVLEGYNFILEADAGSIAVTVVGTPNAPDADLASLAKVV